MDRALVVLCVCLLSACQGMYLRARVEASIGGLAAEVIDVPLEAEFELARDFDTRGHL
jgi:hypothetical protein